MKPVKTDDEAYAQFVDYTCLVTVMPFAEHPDLLPAMLEFFEGWYAKALVRAEGEKT